jgi:hypothetical protein
MPYKNPEKKKEHRQLPEIKKREIECSKNWAKKNREKSRDINRRYIHRLHDKVIDLLGGKCIRCGITDKRVLQVNHMNGGGCQEFKKLGAAVFYNQILQGKRKTDDLEARCSNCNIIYRWEDSERKT